MAKTAVTINTPVAESGGFYDYGISTDICQKVGMLARAEAALCELLAELDAETGLEEAVLC